MTPTEAFILRFAGMGTRLRFATTITLTLCYGMLVPLFALSTRSLLRRGLKPTPTKIMFLVTIIAFVCATVTVVSRLLHQALQIQSIYVDFDPEKFNALTLVGPDTKYEFFYFIQGWMETLLVIMGDGIVVWRAWALFPGETWMMIGPCVLLFATAATKTTWAALYSKKDYNLLSPKGSPLSRLNDAGLALSLGTNFLTTCLILYKLWTHRSFQAALGLKKRSSPVERVMLILVESGVLLLAIQLGSLITDLVPYNPQAPMQYVGSIFYAVWIMSMTLYPSAVVFLVDQERSLVETFGLSVPPKHSPVLDDMAVEQSATHQEVSVALQASRQTDTDTLDSMDGVIAHHDGRSEIPEKEREQELSLRESTILEQSVVL
ncbi:hypothetical protein DXG03_008832 [Asterophora parasitica]|uniref:Uncharacterized protein n=1 Tax=Asterophora parasitica TaxID=117018 RepID=A0A9P7G535_9AGAR|nr:hypothetical protein DXG03_008832 [Asterophora parasitica]